MSVAVLLDELTGDVAATALDNLIAVWVARLASESRHDGIVV